ncbi:16S rRNA (guanine(966)-N(2))-methyltransferase RsmD [Gemmatimonadota bacterium]
MRIIAGRWKGRRLQSLRGKGVRPTTDRVREAWMAAMGSVVEDARVLDLFSGSGALGLEALSRGAREVVFVEKARGALAALQANIRLLGAEDECRVVRGDATAYARRLEPGSFDLALADPPYDKGLAHDLLVLFHQTGFAAELWVEHRSKEEMAPLAGLRQRRYGDTTLSILTRDE